MCGLSYRHYKNVIPYRCIIIWKRHYILCAFYAYMYFFSCTQSFKAITVCTYPVSVL